jgi:pimeloyl-ACP methyl ester carboxylesterase
MTGILLVHGAWHGPWCWDGFAQRLAGHGHQVHAVQLRGHDGSPGRIWHRVRDYVADVGEAASRFAAPPVLVGHSLGGLVVQKYLERHPAPGAVLLASVPPGGMLLPAARLAARHPLVSLQATLLLRLRPLVATRKLVRELFFSPDTPQELVDDTFGCLQDESYLTLLDPLVVWPRPHRVQAPVLVLGAERDGFFTAGEVHRTARAYRTRAEIYPGMGHNLMLDTGWPQVADRIHTWISELPPRGGGRVRARTLGSRRRASGSPHRRGDA